MIVVVNDGKVTKIGHVCTNVITINFTNIAVIFYQIATPLIRPDKEPDKELVVWYLKTFNRQMSIVSVGLHHRNLFIPQNVIKSQYQWILINVSHVVIDVIQSK